MNALDHDSIQRLYELADGDESFVRDVLATYVDQAQDQVKALHLALVAGDRRAAARAAHSLAGASLNVGALTVANVCRRIEAMPSLDFADLSIVEAELNRLYEEPLLRQ